MLLFIISHTDLCSTCKPRESIQTLNEYKNRCTGCISDGGFLKTNGRESKTVIFHG